MENYLCKERTTPIVLNLADFFSPLSFSNLIIFVLFIICCEVIGYRLAMLFADEIPSFIRGATWLLGLGMVVFIYFLSHYFIPLSYPTILYVLIILMIPSAKYYIETKGIKSLGVFGKNKILPFIFVLFILPQMLVKFSQPPYVWDEMAYHFISPYTLYYERVWDTGSSFYLNLPRLLDTAYTALFSLTNTYSIARLLNFSIFISFLFTAFSYLKQRFSFTMALAFFVLTLFSPGNFPLWSSFGYVDIGTMSFSLIGFILLFDYFERKNIVNLTYGLAFFGMAIGSKYSALAQFLSFSVISIFLLLKNKGVLFVKNKKLLVGAGMFLILGGYWYIKNFIVTGNPIYPLLFGCNFSRCETVDMSFTLPFAISNIQAIYFELFLDNIAFQILFIFSVVFSLAIGSEKARKLVVFILSFLIIETIFIKNISGFYARYFYHWQALAILVIVAPLSIVNKENIIQMFKKNK